MAMPLMSGRTTPLWLLIMFSADTTMVPQRLITRRSGRSFPIPGFAGWDLLHFVIPSTIWYTRIYGVQAGKKESVVSGGGPM
jgi:hypothetical protein